MSFVVAALRSRLPRSPQNTALYGLVLDHYERFASNYEERFAERFGPLRSHVTRTFERYLECGDFSNGCLRVSCESSDCGYDMFVPFSCKRAICPSCAQRRSLEFSEFVEAEVLEPVAYRHVVFTVPKVLRAAFLRDRKLLLERTRCAWKTIVRALRMGPGNRQAVSGAVIARATAGDLVVRRERLAPATAEKLLQWNPSGFSVWLGDPIEPYQTESRQRLARYLTKSPVALHRMDYDPTTCLVSCKSSAQGRSRTVTALDFMAELQMHIPDPGEHAVSYFGRCSNRTRGKRRKAELAAPLQGGCPPPPIPSRRAYRKSWAKLLSQVWQVDVTTCPRCRGELKIIAAITHPRSCQRLIEHLGLPRARAPNPHDCPPPPGQLRLPLDRHRADQPPVTADPPAQTVVVHMERDPHLDADWPNDAPFADD